MRLCGEEALLFSQVCALNFQILRGIQGRSAMNGSPCMQACMHTTVYNSLWIRNPRFAFIYEMISQLEKRKDTNCYMHFSLHYAFTISHTHPSLSTTYTLSRSFDHFQARVTGVTKRACQHIKRRKKHINYICII